MRKLLLIAFGMFFVCSLNAQKRIIGGSQTSISERPYQAALFTFWDENHLDPRSYGGAVIIDNQWLLTAAHCVCNQEITKLAVEVGETCVNPYDDLLGIDNIYIHPDYDSTYLYNDIALIKLSSPITFNSKKMPIKISPTFNYVSGTNGVVSGWGRRSYGGPLSLSQLYKADVTISSCSDTQIVAAASANMAYSGDSGGPLTIVNNNEELLIGLVSSCSNSDLPTYYPSHYTNVGYYCDWINSTIYSMNAPRVLCSSESFFANVYGGSYTLGPTLSATTLSDGRIQISGTGSAYSYVKIYDRWGNLVNQKNFWVGIPSISNITYDDSDITLETFGYDMDIQRVEWRIGVTPYVTLLPELNYPRNGAPLRQTTVKARATNGCGTTSWFTTTLMLPRGNGGIITSFNPDTKCIEVRNAIYTEEESALLASSGLTDAGMISYQMANARNGLMAVSGHLPVYGGSIDCSNHPKGLYILTITLADGEKEIIKIKL